MDGVGEAESDGAAPKAILYDDVFCDAAKQFEHDFAKSTL